MRNIMWLFLPDTTVGWTLVKTSFRSDTVLLINLSVLSGVLDGKKLHVSQYFSLLSTFCFCIASRQKSVMNTSKESLTAISVDESDMISFIFCFTVSSMLKFLGVFGLDSDGGVYGGGGLSGISRKASNWHCCCSRALICNCHTLGIRKYIFN